MVRLNSQRGTHHVYIPYLADGGAVGARSFRQRSPGRCRRRSGAAGNTDGDIGRWWHHLDREACVAHLLDNEALGDGRTALVVILPAVGLAVDPMRC